MLSEVVASVLGAGAFVTVLAFLALVFFTADLATFLPATFLVSDFLAEAGDKTFAIAVVDADVTAGVAVTLAGLPRLPVALATLGLDSAFAGLPFGFAVLVTTAFVATFAGLPRRLDSVETTGVATLLTAFAGLPRRFVLVETAFLTAGVVAAFAGRPLRLGAAETAFTDVELALAGRPLRLGVAETTSFFTVDTALAGLPRRFGAAAVSAIELTFALAGLPRRFVVEVLVAAAFAGRPLFPLTGVFNPIEDNASASNKSIADFFAEDLRPSFFGAVPILETIALIA
jgi:hypothetical protein